MAIEDVSQVMWMSLFLIILYNARCCHGNQTALFNDLFSKKYQKCVQPVCDKNAPIEIKVGMAIRQFIDLDEPTETMTVNIWMRLQWYDCQLRWNPGKYGEIEDLALPANDIGTPDLTLYDNSEANVIKGIKDYRAVVHSNGSVFYNFPTILKSICEVDVTVFPFDTQHCNLTFGSWAYHEGKLSITSEERDFDVVSYKSSSEWDLVEVPVRTYTSVFFGYPYSVVTFSFTVNRKPLFYIMSIVFPCILISLVALLGFLLPQESGEKISLEITVLLALYVFMLMVSDMLPSTSDSLPIIGIYFAFAMLLVTLSTMCCVGVLNVHYSGNLGAKVPQWLKKMFMGRLARLVFVDVPHPIAKDSSEITRNVEPYRQASVVSDNSIPEQYSLENIQQHPSPSNSTVPCQQLSIMKKFDERYTAKENRILMENEWKTLAVILDRFFLLIFSVISLLGAVVILAR